MVGQTLVETCTYVPRPRAEAPSGPRIDAGAYVDSDLCLSIYYLQRHTGRPASFARVQKLRTESPGRLCIWHIYAVRSSYFPATQYSWLASSLEQSTYRERSGGEWRAPWDAVTPWCQWCLTCSCFFCQSFGAAVLLPIFAFGASCPGWSPRSLSSLPLISRGACGFSTRPYKHVSVNTSCYSYYIISYIHNHDAL